MTKKGDFRCSEAREVVKVCADCLCIAREMHREQIEEDESLSFGRIERDEGQGLIAELQNVNVRLVAMYECRETDCDEVMLYEFLVPIDLLSEFLLIVKQEGGRIVRIHSTQGQKFVAEETGEFQAEIELPS